MDETLYNHAKCTVEDIVKGSLIGLRVTADTAERLFGCTGEAMFALIGAQIDPDAASRPHSVVVVAPDAAALMEVWLSELLRLHQETGEIFTECAVSEWYETGLTAIAHGHVPATGPSVRTIAVDQQHLQVSCKDNICTAQVYFDI